MGHSRSVVIFFILSYKLITQTSELTDGLCSLLCSSLCLILRWIWSCGIPKTASIGAVYVVSIAPLIANQASLFMLVCLTYAIFCWPLIHRTTDPYAIIGLLIFMWSLCICLRFFHRIFVISTKKNLPFELFFKMRVPVNFLMYSVSQIFSFVIKWNLHII